MYYLLITFCTPCLWLLFHRTLFAEDAKDVWRRDWVVVQFLSWFLLIFCSGISVFPLISFMTNLRPIIQFKGQCDRMRLAINRIASHLGNILVITLGTEYVDKRCELGSQSHRTIRTNYRSKSGFVSMKSVIHGI